MKILVNDKVRIGQTGYNSCGASRLLLPVGLMGTCVELSRYQVLIAMGIGFGIEGVEEALGYRSGPENRW